jgi:hypothetical protein
MDIPEAMLQNYAPTSDRATEFCHVSAIEINHVRAQKSQIMVIDQHGILFRDCGQPSVGGLFGSSIATNTHPFQ